MTPAGKARLGETPQAQAEEAPRPPAKASALRSNQRFKQITTLQNTNIKLFLYFNVHFFIDYLSFVCYISKVIIVIYSYMLGNMV
ncbi:hypothetical protein SAMN05878482_10198 [Peribacillus simplex]|uniref:Uncharacterized protein n=1 Tax=Peribacillus simplex TaxID=1478 RepID=A0A9X8R1E5_9BACI|nr:hypothetical protein SAMN05878482_10198 [Peribacillus simplex]